jgi:60 kDa SS-A/Ro ribonucleoprotein
MRGWGRGLRAAVAEWYGGREAKDLAYQAVKYQQRDGWGHRDLLRLSHPKATPESAHNAIYQWIVRSWDTVGPTPPAERALHLLWAFEQVKRAESKEEVAGLIHTYGLPREAIPTQWLAEPAVWEALLDAMPITALLRNLATLTRPGLLTDASEVTRRVAEQLTDAERLRRGRIHPIQVLAALRTYAQGHGERGGHTWRPAARIMEALDAGFYASFGSVRPSGKRWLLAMDVSGSMDGCQIAGIPGLTPRVASAAMALITASVEPEHQFAAFTCGADGFGGRWDGGTSALTPLGISPQQRLDDVVHYMAALPMGGTDCALPMLYALRNRLEVDCFVVYTDSETWHGEIHPAQALWQYRDQMGIPARLVVCGMVSNSFTIADPNDAGMLDVVGFDTATPNLISDFAAFRMGAASA